MTEAERPCLNCGRALRGRYCHECGQEAVEVRVPLRTLLPSLLLALVWAVMAG